MTKSSKLTLFSIAPTILFCGIIFIIAYGVQILPTILAGMGCLAYFISLFTSKQKQISAIRLSLYLITLIIVVIYGKFIDQKQLEIRTELITFMDDYHKTHQQYPKINTFKDRENYYKRYQLSVYYSPPNEYRNDYLLMLRKGISTEWTLDPKTKNWIVTYK